MQVLQDITSFEETLLSAKKFIDDWQCSELIFIVPEIEIESCKRIAHLVSVQYSISGLALEISFVTCQRTPLIKFVWCECFLFLLTFVQKAKQVLPSTLFLFLFSFELYIISFGFLLFGT